MIVKGQTTTVTLMGVCHNAVCKCGHLMVKSTFLKMENIKVSFNLSQSNPQRVSFPIITISATEVMLSECIFVLGYANAIYLYSKTFW